MFCWSMRLIKLPDKFTAKDFADYLYAKAKEKGYTVPGTPPRSVIKAFTGHLSVDKFDPYFLVSAIDHLLETYANTVPVGPMLVSQPAMAVEEVYFDTNRHEVNIVLLKHRWLKRFAKSHAQAYYYEYWLAALEDAKDAPDTAPAYIEDVRYRTWADVATEAVIMLEDAESYLKVWLKEKGFLEERFYSMAKLADSAGEVLIFHPDELKKMRVEFQAMKGVK